MKSFSKKAEMFPYVILGIVAIVAISGIVISFNNATITAAASKKGCTTIQDGTIKYENPTCGNIIPLGFDKWGHNYQAHTFKGKYCDNYCNATWCQPYSTVDLEMKWNDAWLSNKDCDGDGFLDYGTNNWEDAWITNHMKDTYEMDGKTCTWTWFVKIVYWPDQAACAAAGGVPLWGQFCQIESVYNDPCGGYHGVEQLLIPPGLGGGVR